MFYFKGTRRPNFKNIPETIYPAYWQSRSLELRNKLMEREVIFFNWIEPKTKVLSLGCGNSRLLLDLKEKKNCLVYGLDIDENVVNLQKQFGIEVKRGDLAAIDFELKSYFDFNFDYIIMSELLEHLALPENLISKLKEQSRYFIFSVPNSAFYRYRLGLLCRGRFFTQWAVHPAEHLRFWSHLDFYDWLSGLGLKIIKCQSSNGPMFLKDLWSNMFGHQICYFCHGFETPISGVK